MKTRQIILLIVLISPFIIYFLIVQTEQNSERNIDNAINQMEIEAREFMENDTVFD
jgi:hypothetical protein